MEIVLVRPHCKVIGLWQVVFFFFLFWFYCTFDLCLAEFVLTFHEFKYNFLRLLRMIFYVKMHNIFDSESVTGNIFILLNIIYCIAHFYYRNPCIHSTFVVVNSFFWFPWIPINIQYECTDRGIVSIIFK